MLIDTDTLSDAQTLRSARNVVQEHLPVEANGYSCTTDTLTDALLAVAARGDSLETVCQDLQAMPASQTLRHYFNEALTPEALALVEARINLMLEAAVPGQLLQRLNDQVHEVALDLHERPYDGKAEQDEALYVRAQAQVGTTRFHRVATAYLVRGGTRFTLAVHFVRSGERATDTVRALVNRLEALEVAIRHLLMDKGFCSISVMQYLQRSTHSAIIACPIRGKRGGTRALCQGPRSYRRRHTFQNDQAQFTAEILVCRSFTTARRTGRMKRRLRWQLFVVIACGLPAKKVRRLYSRRFGIEASYRQAGLLSARTSSRNGVYRFLLLGLSFVLLSVWTALRFLGVQVPRRGQGDLDEGHLRLRRFRRFLQRALDEKYGCCREIKIRAAPIL